MNLDPQWTQAGSSIVALLIAVGVPYIQKHWDMQKEKVRIEENKKNQIERLNALKQVIDNYLIYSDFEFGSIITEDDEYGRIPDIQLFENEEAFRAWLKEKMLSATDTQELKILHFGEMVISESHLQYYTSNIGSLRNKLKNL